MDRLGLRFLLWLTRSVFVESLGLGLVRTGTLSTGAAKCDFRWRR